MQYIWQHRLWPRVDMFTVDRRRVTVIDPGVDGVETFYLVGAWQPAAGLCHKTVVGMSEVGSRYAI